LPADARVVVLVNPAARSAHDRKAIANATRTLERRYRVEVIAPRGVDALAAAARGAAGACDVVIVAGGDGTLHRVMNAIDGTGAAIGLLPIGTGNDFARALRVPADPAAAATRILDGRIRQIDLVAVNDRLFCTVGVLGLAAEATIAFDRLQRTGSWTRPVMRAFGGWSYRIAGLDALLRRGTQLEHVAVDSAEFQPIYGAFVTNTTLLGGGMKVPVDSDVADGQIEIASITPLSRARLYWAFLCLANGWRVPEGALHVVRTDRATITCARRLPFAADGEVVCEECRFDVAVRPGALRVVC
jgi:diacylglycerol kinase (ATP)